MRYVQLENKNVKLVVHVHAVVVKSDCIWKRVKHLKARSLQKDVDALSTPLERC